MYIGIITIFSGMGRSHWKENEGGRHGITGGRTALGCTVSLRGISGVNEQRQEFASLGHSKVNNVDRKENRHNSSI